MSLLVWLPLINDNHNQGLLNLTPTDLGTVSYINGGKIGKCLSAGDGTSSAQANGLSYNSNLVEELGTEFSCAVWVKPLGNHIHYDGAIISSGNWNAQHWSFGLSQDNSKVSVFGNGHSRYITCTVPTNTWTHLCCTSHGGVTKLYKNGEYIGQTTLSALASNATNFAVGRETYASGYFSFNGNINDVRIYNHVLSLKEIKELAKGLVCHYPLNGNGRSGDNIVSGTQRSDFSTSSTSPSDGKLYVGSGGNGTFSITTDSTCPIGIYSYNVLNNTSGNRDFQQAHIPYIVGKQYTGSWWAKGTGTCLYRVWDGDTGSERMRQTFTLTSDWKYYSHTFTATQEMQDHNCTFHLGVTGTASINMCGMKLEQNDHPTPWMPNSADAAYTSMGYNSTTEYDVSGYKYNGTKWNYDSTGSIEYSSNTPRYSVSTFINSANVSNNTTGMRYIYGNCELTTPQYLTVAFWCNPIATYGSSNGIFALTNNDIGTGAATDYNTAPMHNRDAYIDMCTSTNVHKTMAFTTTANEWHHYAVVYDGRYGRVYKDGVHTATLDMGSNLSLASFKAIVIGYSHAGGVYRKVQAYYSDFRIYATALSADDVKELYNTVASVANNGTLLTRGEIVES